MKIVVNRRGDINNDKITETMTKSVPNNTVIYGLSVNIIIYYHSLYSRIKFNTSYD